MQYLFDFLVIINVVFKISFTILFSQTRNNEKKISTTSSKKKATSSKEKATSNKEKTIFIKKKTIFSKRKFVANVVEKNNFIFFFATICLD